MTALGIYLLISLFFVLGGIAEFAILIFMLRRSENLSHNANKVKNKKTLVDINHTENDHRYEEDRRSSKSSFKSRCHVNHNSLKNHCRKASFKNYSYTIDLTSSIMFPIAYIAFNIIYWTHYLN